MKKLFYPLLAVSIIFAACKKENAAVNGCMDAIATNYNVLATSDDGTCTYGLVGGAWVASSTTLDAHVTITLGGMTLMDSTWTEVENNPDSLEPYKLKFLNDGTYTEYDQSDAEIESGTWSQSENEISITDSDTTFVVTLVSISKETAALEIDLSDTETDDGMTVTSEGTMSINFNRDENGFTTNNTNQRKGNTSWFDKSKLLNIIK